MFPISKSIFFYILHAAKCKSLNHIIITIHLEYELCYHIYLYLGAVTIVPTEGGTTYVNGREIHEPMKLTTGSRIILGNNHVFRFNNPDEGKAVCTQEFFTIECRSMHKIQNVYLNSPPFPNLRVSHSVPAQAITA